jgi:hypothetical protein
MAFDPHDFDDDDLPKEPGRGRKFSDFDCPGCSANNPRDEKFGDGEEIMCFYCGAEFRARVDDEGRLKLREL